MTRPAVQFLPRPRAAGRDNPSRGDGMKSGTRIVSRFFLEAVADHLQFAGYHFRDLAKQAAAEGFGVKAKWAMAHADDFFETAKALKSDAPLSATEEPSQ